MTWDTPIGTVWPAFIAFFLWLFAVRRVWREVRLPSGWWAFMLFCLLVRLVWIPALGVHEFDGHEAEYWDL